LTDATPAFAKRVKRQVSGKFRQSFIVTAPGLEKLTAAKLSTLPISDPLLTIQYGGISFNTKLKDVMLANLHLRTANRILLRLVKFNVDNFYTLEKKLADFPWELFLYQNQDVSINVTCRQSRLYHSKAVSQRVYQSIIERQKFMVPGSNNLSHQTLFVRINNNRLILSLDSSGEPLYKRGLKGHGGTAPLRETLAVAILQIAGYDPKKPLVDPMCGVGSFSLEAAMIAKKMAAGLHRKFAFESWPAFQSKQWEYLKQNAQKSVIQLPQPTIFASDHDQRATNALSDSIKKHHLTDVINVTTKDFFELTPEDCTSRKGLVVLNPPYGIRLGINHSPDRFFPKIIHKLKSDYKGWRIALLAPQNTSKKMRPFFLKSFDFFHGGLTIRLLYGKIR
jgi:putative N6-adenine-specific DNA methylase